MASSRTEGNFRSKKTLEESSETVDYQQMKTSMTSPTYGQILNINMMTKYYKCIHKSNSSNAMCV